MHTRSWSEYPDEFHELDNDYPLEPEKEFK